jgi:hypothetical protein
MHVLQYNLAGMYSPGLPRFAEVMHVFGELVRRRLPALHTHFAKHGVDHAMYASQVRTTHRKSPGYFQSMDMSRPFAVVHHHLHVLVSV